jgi:hypothetical protein
MVRSWVSFWLSCLYCFSVVILVPVQLIGGRSSLCCVVRSSLRVFGIVGLRFRSCPLVADLLAV